MEHLKQKLQIEFERLQYYTGMKKKKVFAIGFNKSGTTSLHALFISLGLSSYHGVEWRGCDNLALLRSYDCFSDDIPKDLPRLDYLFPGSKFILQVRDLDSWVYSRLAHIEREQKQGTHMAKPNWDITEFAIKAWIKKRNEHHLFVLEYFSRRPADFIVINFIRDDAAATTVSRFLGYSGTYQKPKININPDKDQPLKYSKMLMNAIADLGIPEQELKFDIYCPSLLINAAESKFPVDSSLLT